MKRREFITLVGAAATWSLVAQAQQRKLPLIGLLGASTPSGWASYTAAFEQRLRELGWIAARTVAFDYVWAEGQTERYDALAAELVRSNADVIVTVGSAVAALRKTTSTIPIVFALEKNPIASGFVPSLARPGGNLTGLSQDPPGISTKRFGLLREVVPELRRLAVMANGDYAAAMQELSEVMITARSVGLEAQQLLVRHPDDVVPAIASIKGASDALYVCSDAKITSFIRVINREATAAHLPTMHGTDAYVSAGGLMSYGANNADLFRRAGDFVDKILRGAKPADIPVELATKFDLAVNLKTAHQIGIAIPETFLVRADKVIE